MQTVNALARKEAHVPYRRCRLTSILKDALGGNSKTIMIANVWPAAAHTEETVSTLRFAERMRMLTTQVRCWVFMSRAQHYGNLCRFHKE